MTIACGHCKGRHSTIFAVRECSIPHNAVKAFENAPQRFVREEEAALAIPAQGRMQYVPPGLYALATSTGLKFYKVERPTEGRWKDYTFVSIQHSDEFTQIKDSARKGKILRTIGNDPEGAMALYGKTIGRCGKCSRTLTNEESRARGIGPVCAEALGW